MHGGIADPAVRRTGIGRMTVDRRRLVAGELVDRLSAPPGEERRDPDVELAAASGPTPGADDSQAKRISEGRGTGRGAQDLGRLTAMQQPTELSTGDPGQEEELGFLERLHGDRRRLARGSRLGRGALARHRL